MLQAHHHDTYGEDHTSSSTSSEDEPNIRGTTPVAMATTPVGTELEESTHRAIAVLKQHEDFMHRQQVLAEQYRKEREAMLPRGVSSKKAVLDCSEQSDGDGPHSQQGRQAQTEKNRKRKLKKRKAKEKRHKIDNTIKNRASI